MPEYSFPRAPRHNGQVCNVVRRNIPDNWSCVQDDDERFFLNGLT